MGYGVYRDSHRWAGYMIPAECDLEFCKNKINRGLDYKCETHFIRGEAGDYEEEGCGDFYCLEHLFDTYLHLTYPSHKPDTLGWIWWICTEPSWKQWRRENPEQVRAYVARLTDSTLEEHLNGGTFELAEDILTQIEIDRAIDRFYNG